jgi:hypothetical protein
MGKFLKLLGRIVGLVFVLAGAVVFVGDLVAIVSGRGGTVLGRLWFETHLYSLNFSQAIIQRYINPLIWDPGIVSVLQMPAWQGLTLVASSLVFIGLVLLWLCGRGQQVAAAPD